MKQEIPNNNNNNNNINTNTFSADFRLEQGNNISLPKFPGQKKRINREQGKAKMKRKVEKEQYVTECGVLCIEGKQTSCNKNTFAKKSERKLK